jgi:hypothetical protein
MSSDDDIAEKIDKFAWIHLPEILNKETKQYVLCRIYRQSRDEDPTDLYLVKLTTNVNELPQILSEGNPEKFEFTSENIKETITSDFKIPKNNILQQNRYIVVNKDRVRFLPRQYKYNSASTSNKHWFDPFDIGQRYPYMITKQNELIPGRVVYVSLDFTAYHESVAKVDINFNQYNPNFFGEVLAIIEESTIYTITDQAYNALVDTFSIRYNYYRDAYTKVVKVRISKQAKKQFMLKQDFYKVPYGAIKLIPDRVSDITNFSEFDGDITEQFMSPIVYNSNSLLCNVSAMLKLYAGINDPPDMKPPISIKPKPGKNQDSPPSYDSLENNRSGDPLDKLLSVIIDESRSASTRSISDGSVSTRSGSTRSISDGSVLGPYISVYTDTHNKRSIFIPNKRPILTNSTRDRQRATVGGYKPRKQLLHSKKPNNISRRRKSIKFKNSRKPRNYKKTKKNKKNKKK